MAKYILAVDQSTQGTKALLLDGQGALVCRADRPHKQLIDSHGWVEHDPEEIYANTLHVLREAVEKSKVDPRDIAALGMSNQRETTVCWDRRTGRQVYNAIVWQCARGAAICEELEARGCAQAVQEKTGLKLSPYFPAPKLAWILRNVPGAAEMAERGELAAGTIDSWLVYRLTGGERHQTDYSNASRTMLFNIRTLEWDDELLEMFGVPRACMPAVTDSDGDYGMTDLGGYLERPIPILGVLGDSHGALLGHGCRRPGMVKATYGTGSSIMMNIGEAPAFSEDGLVTSLAWKLGGRVNYVLEGNINYSAAVVTWLKDDMRLISRPEETEALARAAQPGDTTYLVPAFSGLGAPHWDSRARACICGMSRMTGRNEIVRAALDCIAYQIADVVNAMAKSAGRAIGELRVDGGASANAYLMQFQSDILDIPVMVSDEQELSGIGAAYAAGIASGVYDAAIFDRSGRRAYMPAMQDDERSAKLDGWQRAVRMVRT